MQCNWSDYACVPRACCMRDLGPYKPCTPYYGGPSRGQRPMWPSRQPNPYYGYYGYDGAGLFFIGDFRDFSEIEHLGSEGYI
ncbi:MAG: hypothetical protein FWB76_06525 [Oscillospiraceae bacterium]|nr:hypothetical protein [Oscillospiraceae bacterium]